MYTTSYCDISLRHDTKPGGTLFFHKLWWVWLRWYHWCSLWLGSTIRRFKYGCAYFTFLDCYLLLANEWCFFFFFFFFLLSLHLFYLFVFFWIAQYGWWFSRAGSTYNCDEVTDVDDGFQGSVDFIETVFKEQVRERPCMVRELLASHISTFETNLND